MLRFIRYRGKVILASESMKKKYFKKMKEYAEFAERLNENKKEETK